MRTKIICSRINEMSGYGAGSGDEEVYEYECLCKKGKIIEEHQNVPGFREHKVWIDCKECNKKYEIDKSKGVRNWQIIEKK